MNNTYAAPALASLYDPCLRQLAKSLQHCSCQNVELAEAKTPNAPPLRRTARRGCRCWALRRPCTRICAASVVWPVEFAYHARFRAGERVAPAREPCGERSSSSSSSSGRVGMQMQLDWQENLPLPNGGATTERTDPPPTVLNSNVAIFGAGVRSCTEKRLSLGQPLLPSRPLFAANMP